ncbi:MAG: hypothetical protein IJU37_07655 [Desulfovibrio sp.]|nr:hypothetical protein [Desulfovibrio sp.]
MLTLRTGLLLLLAVFLSVPAQAKNPCTFFACANAAYKGNAELIYPVFRQGNAAAARNINSVLGKVVPDFIQKERDSYKEDISVKSTYAITYNHKDYLSLVFTFTYGLEGWPQTHMRGYVFDSVTGRQLQTRDLPVTVKDIEYKLHIMGNVKGIPFDANRKLLTMPDNFYYDQDFSLHFLFGKGNMSMKPLASLIGTWTHLRRKGGLHETCSLCRTGNGLSAFVRGLRAATAPPQTP